MIDFKKNGIPAILIALGVINLFLVLTKERTFTAASSSIDGTATVAQANKILMYNAHSKLVPSKITCSDAGDLSCKKLMVGDVNFDFSNAQMKGIAYVDDHNTLRISGGVTCTDDGAVACKKLRLGAISVELDEGIPGTLVLDSVDKKIRVSSGATVTTDNKEVKVNHIALFEAGKVNAIKPSRFKLVDDPAIDEGVMVLENGTIKPESSATYLRFERNLPANPNPGTVVVHGPNKNELAYYNALCFDIDNMKAASPGDYLYVNEDKRIGAKGGGVGGENTVTNASENWKEGHLLVSTAQPKVCELSQVKLDPNFSVANIPGEHLIINENDILKPVLTTNLLRAENPNKLTNLEKRLATFAPNSTSIILPSPFTIEFDPNDANNVERALVLTEMNKLTLKDIKTLPVTTVGTDPPPALNELAIYNNITNKLEQSGLKIDDALINGKSSGNVDAILTVRNKVIQFATPPVVPTILRDGILDVNKHYLPVMGGTKDDVNIKVSNIEIDGNNKLIIPSGEIQLGNTTICAKPAGNAPLANGMYLVYDEASTSFLPQKPAFSGITFETPIANVQKPSHVVLENGKWNFREYSSAKVTKGPALEGTNKLVVKVLEPQVVPGLEYVVGAETSCVIFAECVAAWKGTGIKIPVVRFFLRQGSDDISRKYYAHVQSATKFSITNYVSIFQVVDTSTKKDRIQMMVETVTAEDPLTNETAVNVHTFGDYMNGLANPPDSNNDLKCRMYVRKVF